MNGEPAPRIIIDCDPGHDDALALITAAVHADIVGITTVAGNAPLEATTRNALIVAELAGITAPVHAGAERPLVAEARHAGQVHGKSGLDGPPPREPRGRPASDDAVAWLIETIRSQEGLWLVPLGPLTNVALAFRQAPDLPRRLAGVSLMGGSSDVGNRTATAEFNVWADPEAAAMVFDAGVERLLMCGLNLTRQLTADEVFIARLRSSGHGAARFCADLIGFYVDRYEEQTGRRAAVLHDVCAVLAVTHPDLFEFERRHVVVELNGTHTRGMTVVDERTRLSEAANASVAYRIDAPVALEILHEAIMRADG